MRYFAVIDTNVIVSALLVKNSIPAEILRHVYAGRLRPLFNGAIMREYREVLSRPKFHGKFTRDDVAEILDCIRMRGIYIDPETIDLDLPDPKDCVFYAVVMERRKEQQDGTYLVTGNLKHFPSEIFIVSPRKMFEILSETP